MLAAHPVVVNTCSSPSCPGPGQWRNADSGSVFFEKWLAVACQCSEWLVVAFRGREWIGAFFGLRWAICH